MAMRTLLKWRNEDSSADVNARLQGLAAKGFVTGGVLTGLPTGNLNVTISPFTAISEDGAVVVSDATETTTVVDGVDNYICLRARYVPFQSPQHAIQVMSAAAYAADIDQVHLLIIARVNFTVGVHAIVTAADVDYDLRHITDRVQRSFWRDPVALSGNLPVPPLDVNRHGDVRLVTGSGSFYWWDNAAQLWRLFDEVPVQLHRDEEHTNGITAASAAGTLLPTVSGTDITIAAVPAGSAYTVDGMRLDLPVAITTIAAGAGGRTSEGLIQVAANNAGVITASYRASYAAAVNVTGVNIVGISDNHAATAGLILAWDDAANTLSWNGGEPVVVAANGRFRLFRPSYDSWIEVQVTFASLPIGSIGDSVTTFASAKTDTSFLIAHYRWSGAGGLTLGEDKRTFGNLGYPEMSDDFKNTEHRPRWNDLRGNMVYEGGTMTVLGGLTMRITGPLTAYVAGKRFTNIPITTGVGNLGYTGITFPGAGALQTRWVYVDASGVFTVSATDPSTVTGLQYASVGKVEGVAGTIITNEDHRDPQLVVGRATRDSRVRFTSLASARWREIDKRLVVEDNNSTLGVTLETGGLRVTQNRIRATTGALAFEDTNTLVTGTVTLTNGLATLVGSGTAFLSELPQGTRLRVYSQNGGVPPAEDTVYTILAVTTNTAATLTANYTGVTGAGKSLIRPQAVSSTADNNLTLGQPLNPLPSVIGTLRDIQNGQKFTQGVETGCAPTYDSPGPASKNVYIAAGTFYDSYGRRVVIPSTITVTVVTASSTVYIIKWDPDLNSGAGGFTAVTLLSGSDIQDLPFALVKTDAGNTGFMALEDVRRFADGQYVREFVTVGSSAGFQAANFASLRKALLHIQCTATAQHRPKMLRVISDISEPQNTSTDLQKTVADGGCIKINGTTDTFWGQATARLEGITIVGSESSVGSQQPTVSWGTGGQQGFFIDFHANGVGGGVRNWTFSNVRLAYVGTGLNTNPNIVVFKNPAANMQVLRLQINGGSKLSGLCKWDEGASLNLGGWNAAEGSTASPAGMVWQDVFCSALTPASVATPLFNFNALPTAGTEIQVTNIAGIMAFDRCFFSSSNVYGTLFGCLGAASTTSELAVALRDCRIDHVNVGVFSEMRDARKSLDGCTFSGSTLAPAVNTGTPTTLVSMSRCQFQSDVSLLGAGAVDNSDCVTSATVTGSLTAVVNACDFATGGTFSGAFKKITNSKLLLLATGSLSCIAAQDYVLSNCDVNKINSAAQASQWLDVTTGARVHVSDCEFQHASGSSTGTTPWINVAGLNIFLHMQGCRVLNNASYAGPVIGLDFTGLNNQIDIHDCDLAGNTGSILSASSSVLGNTTSVKFHNNRLDQVGIVTAAGYVIDVVSGAASCIGRLYLNDNDIVPSSGSQVNVLRVQRAKYLTMARNTFRPFSITTMVFAVGVNAATVATEQVSATILDNTIIAESSASEGVVFTVEDYGTTVYDRNKIIVEIDSTAVDAAGISVTLQAPPGVGAARTQPTMRACDNTQTLTQLGTGNRNLSNGLRLFGDSNTTEALAAIANNNNLSTANASATGSSNTLIQIDDTRASTADGNTLTSITAGGADVAQILGTNNIGTASGNTVVAYPSGTGGSIQALAGLNGFEQGTHAGGAQDFGSNTIL